MKAFLNAFCTLFIMGNLYRFRQWFIYAVYFFLEIFIVIGSNQCVYFMMT